MKALRILFSAACIFTALTSCLKDESLNLNYSGYVPIELYDGWDISNPEAEGMDRSILEEMYRGVYIDEVYPTLKAILIVRNGRLVAEAYLKDQEDISRLHNIMSAGKSITSLAAGIALEKGIIASLDTTVYHYLPEYFDSDEMKREITIRQVLTMETGLEFDDDLHASELIDYKGKSLEYIMGKDLVFNPGTDWYYGNGNPQFISGIIQKETGITMAEFVKDNLFDPMRINNFRWEGLKDGLTYGAQGLWLTCRDMAKIGWMLASDGDWEGVNLINPDWIKISTKRQSEYQNYGYYWYPIEDVAFYASGHGGQIIYVYPDKDLVVVLISEPYAKTYNLSAGYTEIFSKIIESLY